MQRQSKAASFIEALVNTTLGYIIAVSAQMAIFPWYDIEVRLIDHVTIGGFFTVVSIARSYCLRRWFNGPMHDFLESYFNRRR